MFTRQHYKAIADILCRTIKHLRENTLDEPVRYIASELADYFIENNARFDRSKFYKACGLTD